jgi:uncharacterized protein YecE (DUF72 family)
VTAPDATAALDKIALGTCAWSYPDWRGLLYPEKLPQTKLLGWYSSIFKAVEVDSTFYHLPSARSSEHWLETTPDDFTFTVKLTRSITHDNRLRDSEALLERFLEGLEPLRAKLGCVLIQLPGSFKPAHDEDALRRFVALLPRDWRFAIEFRDHGWHLPRVIHCLQDHRVAWAWTDTEPYSHEAEGAFEPLPQTADFLYIRLLGDLKTKFHGHGGRVVERYDHLRWPRDRSIDNWSVKIRHHLEESQRIFLFAANHFEGCSPLTAERMARSLGIPLQLPSLDEGAAPGGSSQLDLF